MNPDRAEATTPWRADFSVVPAATLRIALLTLRIIRASVNLPNKNEAMDTIWEIVKPLLMPARLNALRARWNRPDIDDSEDLEGLRPRRGRHSSLDLLVGAGADDLSGIGKARMHRWLTARLTDLPASSLIDAIAAASGNRPTLPAIAVLAESAGLTEAEMGVLDFVEKKDTVPRFSMLLRATGVHSPREQIGLVAAATGHQTAEIRDALRRKGSLATLRLVESCEHSCDLEDFLSSRRLLSDLIAHDPETTEELLAMLVSQAPRSDYTTEDFPHLERDAERLSTALSGAASARMAGVNALLYGPPGTGKTQFALAVAQRAGLKAFIVQTADSDGDGLSRVGRLGAFRLTQRMLANRTDCVVIFDEVEDAFGGTLEEPMHRMLGIRGGHTESDKGWMNQTLESNPVPAIWITNDAASMDPAYLRRFLLPLSFGTPPLSVRQRIVAHHLGGLGIDDALLDALARDDALTPAQFGAARQLISLSPGADPAALIRDGIGASRRLLCGNPMPAIRRSATRFDPRFLNIAGNVSAAGIVRALARNGRGALCFYGPPGTGKTEFAHALAEALDRELVSRSVSDLVSPYVGQTEQNIAALFAGIDSERTVLLIDEVDSLLRSRSEARHGWEVTQVNELLQQMERFPGILIAATNLMGNLDAAAMRRFDFKLEFRPLNARQRLAMFAAETCGDDPDSVPAAIAQRLQALEGLTPGDFANVVRQRRLLDEPMTPIDFVNRLIAECRHKTTLKAAA